MVVPWLCVNVFIVELGKDLLLNNKRKIPYICFVARFQSLSVFTDDNTKMSLNIYSANHLMSFDTMCF